MEIYIQKSLIIHDLRLSGLETSKILDTKWKKTTTLLFKQPTKFIWFNLPYQETLNDVVSINILMVPPGCKEVQYDSDTTSQSYFDK